jgi:tol-pal system protein YbgF
MRGAAWLLLAAAVAGCSSSRARKEEPSTVPAPEPVSQSTPSIDARLTDMQASMTELLDRLDVLNARIAKLENGGQPPPAVQAPQPSTVQPQPALAAQGQPRAAVLHSPLAGAQLADSYRHALMLFGQSRHAEARAAFQQIFDADPSGELADNALYWIGETYYAAGDYSNALRYYARVTKDYPEQNKAPDAMFKMALSYVRTGDLGMARRTFEECIQKYPYSTPAASARMELKRIKD